MPYFVYIFSSRRNGTLHIGSTSDLIKRIWLHKNKLIERFTSKYSVTNLVYFEQYQEISDMAHRERRLKEWKREWKLALIESLNPNWRDLFDDLL